MLYKKILAVAVTVFCAISCFAQQTVEKKSKISDDLTEHYTVLKDRQDVKQGLYQVFTRKKEVVARGGYVAGKKTGIWHFYNKSGKLLQIYDYDKKQLMFEAKQYVGSNIAYIIDRKITDKDTVTKPVKVGGRYFGYLPYLALYRTPFSPYVYNIYGGMADIELLISPLGRLADYKVIANFPFMNYTQTLRMDVNLLPEEDRQFIPANFNHEGILCRIIIKCRVDEDGQLHFLYNDEN